MTKVHNNSRFCTYTFGFWSLPIRRHQLIETVRDRNHDSLVGCPSTDIASVFYSEYMKRVVPCLRNFTITGIDEMT